MADAGLLGWLLSEFLAPTVRQPPQVVPAALERWRTLAAWLAFLVRRGRTWHA